MKRLLIKLFFVFILPISSFATTVKYELDGNEIKISETGVVINGELSKWKYEKGMSIIYFGKSKGVTLNSSAKPECLKLTYTDYQQVIFWMHRDKEVKNISFCQNSITFESTDSTWMFWIWRLKKDKDTYGENLEDMSFEDLNEILRDLI